jgi:hypothetical protein
MNDELNNLIDQAGTIADDASRVFGNLSSQQLNWKPSPERWSVAQCFDHLITANKSYFPAIDRVLEGQRNTSVWERMPLFPSVWGKLLIKSLDPASTRKLKAPKSFAPAQSDVSGTIIEDFVEQQKKVIEQMKATAHLDLEKIIITSPALSVITYSLMDAYRIIVVHEQRHFQQARRVMDETAFPTTGSVIGAT